MSFEEIANLVPGGLPRSAYRHPASGIRHPASGIRHPAWWSNNDRTHPQSDAWHAAGFAARPDLIGRRVRFIQVSDDPTVDP
ncbi:hypothetical protein [Micromonospora sp. NPDC049203]|uniref:DUF7662 domain-containing protein n=1 Tax=Micromonospora sp. NPDC049203 TaxID=3364267 RepID=UPI00372162EF